MLARIASSGRRHAARFATLAAAALLATAPLAASDHELLEQEFTRRIVEEAKSGTAVAPRLTLPTPIAGSPEYLVRVIVLLPTDRQPPVPLDYDAKVADVTAKTRMAMEAMNDFLVYEQERYGFTPGKPLNLERELTGEVRVIVLDGTKPTTGATGYWGNTTGLDGNAIYFNAVNDIFGSATAATTACEKNSFIIFPDTLTMDDSGGSAVYRGYLGLGGSRGTAGYGGIGQMAYGVLDNLNVPAGPTEADRIDALESTLCDSNTNVTMSGYTGPVQGIPPACAATRDLSRAELASLYLGILVHEGLHGLRIGHDGYTGGGVMGSGYPRMGATMRDIHSIATCPGVPLLNPPNCITTVLGPFFSNFVHHNPYFNTTADPDKTDPTIDVAWPPNGHFFGIPAANQNDPYPFVTKADAGGGTALNLGLFYDKGNTFDDDVFGGGTRVAGAFNDFFFDKFVGRRRMDHVATDNAGNIREIAVDAFGMIYTTAEMGTAWNSTFWVRRPAIEDTRDRNGGAPLGTFHNPYSDIQTAIDAAKLGGFGNVLIGEGVWPITTPIRGGRFISISGEGVGRTIFDGGGTASSLILTDAGSNTLEECTISNIVFRNAAAGIVRTFGGYNYNYAITNNVFHNITGRAIDIPSSRGSTEVSGNTIAGCGAGIRMTSYTPFNPPDRLIVRNNVVANCTGEGIRFDAMQGLFSSEYDGYNLSFGNGTNFVGNGDGTTSYASNRLPGEISTNPLFATYPPTVPEDLRLRGGSPALNAAHTANENADASRRDVGAFLGTPVPTIALASAAPAFTNAAISVTATLTIPPSGGTFTDSDVATTNATVSAFSGSGTSWSWTLTPVAEGPFSCSVGTSAFNSTIGIGNVPSGALNRTFDSVAPGLSLASAAPDPTNAAITVTATLSEAPAAGSFTSSDVSTTNANVSAFSGGGTSWSWTLTPVSQGGFSCSVDASAFADDATNANTASGSLSRVFDSVVPTISLASAAPDPTNAAITVTATLSEAPAAGTFTSSDVSATNANVSAFSGGGTSWSWTLTPVAQGGFSCSVDASAFADDATNANTASGPLSRTFDSVAPTITLTSTAPDPTNAAISVTATLSEAPAAGTFDASDVSTSNASVIGFGGSGTSWSWSLIPSAQGSFFCQVPASAIADAATNPNASASNLLGRTYDSIAPASSLTAVADTTRVGTALSLAFTGSDTNAFTTNLWVKAPGAGSFVDSGLTQSGTSGSFAFTATVGANGRYEFASRATDGAGNAETAPTVADTAVLLNTVANGAFTQLTAAATDSLTFPMTDALDILVDVTGASIGGQVTVARTTPLGAAPAGLQANRLIDERLAITQNGLGAFTAEVTWNFDPASDDAITGAINSVYRYDAGVQTGVFPVTPTGTQIVVPGITAFSDWYAGNNDTAVEEWSLF